MQSQFRFITGRNWTRPGAEGGVVWGTLTTRFFFARGRHTVVYRGCGDAVMGGGVVGGSGLNLPLFISLPQG